MFENENSENLSKKERVSVIIPTFNRAQLLERALTSVKGQLSTPYEVIVVDDGSSELEKAKTQEVVDRFQFSMNMKFIQSPHRGVSAARNEGVRLASGEWLAFLDSDDEWSPEKLALQLEYARSHPEINLIHSEETWVRNGVRVNAAKKYKKQGGEVFPHCLPQCCIGTSTVLVKRKHFNKFGGFREDFPVCEDYDLWLKMSLNHRVGLVERPLTTKYGGHQDQLSQKLKAMDYYRVLAIDHILHENFLNQTWKKLAQETLLEKCDVLLKGYLKHDNMVHYSEIETIKARWQ